MSERPGWNTVAEVGSMSALRLMAAIHRALGRRVAALLLYPIAGYFFVTAPRARRASLRYLRTLHAWSRGAAPDHPPGHADVLRHFHSFAVGVFDRMVAWGGGFEHFGFAHSGSEHLFRLARDGRGGILLGAHLGSYDMPRLLAGEHGLVLNVVMFTAHAARVNAFFERLDPSSRLRVLQLDPDSVRSAFAIRACLARGELVAFLADRPPPGAAAARSVTVDFLGRPARIPLSPFLVACTLGAPLLTSICVRTGSGTYSAAVDLLSPGEVVPRRQRDARAAALARDYARVLEQYCRDYPYQWFNFYDYWEDEGQTEETGLRNED